MPYAALLNTNNSAFAGSAYTGTTLTAVSPSPTYAIPAGYLQTGMTFRVQARGVFTSNATATTLTMTLGIGAASVATAATTITASLTGAQWTFDALITVRSVGTSGSVWVQGRGELATALANGTPTFLWLPSTAPAATTLDTTAAANVVLSFTSSAAQSYTCQQFVVEQLNQPG